MYFENLDDKTYIVRLEKGEEVLSSLSLFVKENNIHNATFAGIGSLENPSLAHFNVETKKYSEEDLQGIFELTSLIGNVATQKNEPVIHPHVTISDKEMNVFGGHLVKAYVSATVEITLSAYPKELEKEFDAEIGLNLWKLKNRLEAEDKTK